jgi:hypothetical protein
LVERTLALSAFAVFVALYVALPTVKFSGVPLRGLASLGLAIILPLACPAIAEAVLRKYFPVIAIAIGLALVGTFTSLVNGNPLDIILQTLLEVHLQSIILIFVAGILAEICDGRLCMLAIVAVVCTSALVALLQMFEIDIAWEARRALGPLAKEELRLTVEDRRPTGLSFSPIQLSTQLCLAFAVFAGVRHSIRRRAGNAASPDPAVIVGLLILLIGSFATATRSPILGAIIFIALYALLWRRSWLPVGALLAVGLTYLAWPLVMGIVESEAPRILWTNDNSAATRSVFTYYGMRLIIDNPVGYGFGFQPRDMWAAYWPDLYFMQGARGAQEHALHNYLLSMMNIYGVALLLFVPWAVRLLVRAGPYLIFFVPYAVHIMFHNSGPFFSDMIIWFVIAAIAAGPKTGIPSSEQCQRNAAAGMAVTSAAASWSSMRAEGKSPANR